MARLKPLDVVIAGGGWSGLAMAKEIATRTSLSVVVPERGQRVPGTLSSTSMTPCALKTSRVFQMPCTTAASLQKRSALDTNKIVSSAAR